MLSWIPYNSYSQDSSKYNPKVVKINDTTYLSFTKTESIDLYNTVVKINSYVVILDLQDSLVSVYQNEIKTLKTSYLKNDSIRKEMIVDIKEIDKNILKEEKKRKWIYGGSGILIGILLALILI